MDVGFVGLGAMGTPMAERLLQAGHAVRAWNRSPPALDGLLAKGALPSQSPRDAFAGEAALTMLADDAAVRAVILEQDVLAHAPEGLVHVVCATLSVEFAKELEEVHRHHGVAYVAAPVVGRPQAAAAGELNVLAAGDPEAIRVVQPLLDAFARRTWTLGDEPHKAKIAINFLIAAAIESMAEALALAEGHAVDPARLMEVVTGTLFAAPAYKTYGDLILARKFQPPGFKVTHGLKDVKLALAAGEQAHVPMSFAGILRDNLLDAMAHGGLDQDWSALAGVAFRRAGQTQEP